MDTNQLADVGTADLQIRAGILRSVIAEAEHNGDPRVVNPKSQLEIIEAELKRRDAELKPASITIGLQPLRLHAKRG